MAWCSSKLSKLVCQFSHSRQRHPKGSVQFVISPNFITLNCVCWRFWRPSHTTAKPAKIFPKKIVENWCPNVKLLKKSLLLWKKVVLRMEDKLHFFAVSVVVFKGLNTFIMPSHVLLWLHVVLNYVRQIIMKRRRSAIWIRIHITHWENYLKDVHQNL